MGDQPIEKQMNQKLKTIKKEIEILIALDIKAYNMETYHQFRVLIKKLRAIDFWRKNVMKKSKKIETKALKSLFKKAGEIRSGPGALKGLKELIVAETSEVEISIKF